MNTFLHQGVCPNLSPHAIGAITSLCFASPRQIGREDGGDARLVVTAPAIHHTVLNHIQDIRKWFNLVRVDNLDYMMVGPQDDGRTVMRKLGIDHDHDGTLVLLTRGHLQGRFSLELSVLMVRARILCRAHPEINEELRWLTAERWYESPPARDRVWREFCKIVEAVKLLGGNAPVDVMDKVKEVLDEVG